ncbi:hypothetical protein ARMGADRAFT_496458 [Armillaria gallica]|uniref:Uncharacterized protein n=1 Tax=Armillaria gallica TaxID=47427 RepID=A0A2H3E6E0_ARMGA|nr:hypothetical protein ARMGADRAFT_496458 [Armillaria gallica]
MDGVITDELPNELSRKIDTQPDFQVPVLVPNLHTLHLSGYFDLQVEVYVQMVESWWACHSRHLKSVEGKGRGGSQHTDLSRLDVLVSEGLDVTVSTQRVPRISLPIEYFSVIHTHDALSTERWCQW